MTESLLDHERDNKLMAEKLFKQKQEILEDEANFGIGRKFGAVQISLERPISCTVGT